MKAVVQRVLGTPGETELMAHWKARALREDRPTTNSSAIVSVLDAGVWRVRISSTKFDQGHYMGQRMVCHTERFLDITTSTVRAGTFQKRDSMPTPVIPANSRDTMDFGRLDSAMNELLQQMATVEKPTSEQLAAWVTGYQHCTQWLNNAHTRLAAADDVARALALRLASHL